MVRQMTLDEVLRLFNEEVARAETRLIEDQKKRQDIRRMCFSSPLQVDKRIQGLNWLIIMDKEILGALVQSRDRLLEEMVKEAL